MNEVDNIPSSRCTACRHTVEEHEQLGWSCDCYVCPWKPAPNPNWWIEGDVQKCSVCERTREHCIRRLNTQSAAPICDECYLEETKQ